MYRNREILEIHDGGRNLLLYDPLKKRIESIN